MKAAHLWPDELERVAHGLGIYTWTSYEDLLRKVESWPPAAPKRTRSARAAAADYTGISLTVAWLCVTGVFIGAMKLVNRLGGRK